MEMPVRLGATPLFGVPQKLFSLSTTLNEDNDAVYSLFPGGAEFLISRTVVAAIRRSRWSCTGRPPWANRPCHPAGQPNHRSWHRGLYCKLQV